MSTQAAQQFLSKVSTDAELRAKLEAAIQGKTGLEATRAAQALAQQHGYEATLEELDQERLRVVEELGDEELAGVTGGAAIDNVLDVGRQVSDKTGASKPSGQDLDVGQKMARALESVFSGW